MAVFVMRTSKVYWLLWLYITGPILITLLGAGVCLVLGYEPNEAASNKYFVMGFDIGGILSCFAMAGFFAVFTIPTGLLALVAFRVFLRWQERRSKKE
jgi:hypothetical protein